MVLGARAWGKGSVWRGGWHRIDGAVVGCFDNQGNSLFFEVEPLPYTFYFDLLTPNYAPAVLLPSASIKGYFRLGGAYLLNKSSGGIASPRYTVEFVSQYASIITYDIHVTTERVSLKHRNCVTRQRPYVLIAQFFVLAPVSVLF